MDPELLGRARVLAAVPAPARLIITGGNYLLLDAPPWAPVRALLDEAWFVEVPEAVRSARLAARFVAHGWDPAAARERVIAGTDAANAGLVEPTGARADRVVA